MLKRTDNPPLWPADAPAFADLPGEWFVAHTKARNEKAFAWDLVRRGVGHFLPMVEKTTFSGGRRRRGMQPVFGGYVFFVGTADDRHAALSTGRLCQVIPVNDRPRFVAEIGQLRLALSASADLEFYPHLTVGRRVRVREGPMKGVAGTVVERKAAADNVAGVATVVLSVTMLGVGAAVSVEPELLVPAEEEEAAATPTKRRRSYEYADPPPRRAKSA